MRKPLVSGGFWFSFGLNLLMNYEGAVLAGILLICHFAFQLPLWIPLAVLGIWFASIFLITAVLAFVVKDAPSNPSGTGKPGAGTVRFSSRGDGSLDDYEPGSAGLRDSSSAEDTGEADNFQ